MAIADMDAGLLPIIMFAGTLIALLLGFPVIISNDIGEAELWAINTAFNYVNCILCNC